jgi:hypothetical protein
LVSGGRLVRDDDGQPIAGRRYSDTLLLALLNAHRPPRRERSLRFQYLDDTKAQLSRHLASCANGLQSSGFNTPVRKGDNRESKAEGKPVRGRRPLSRLKQRGTLLWLDAGCVRSLVVINGHAECDCILEPHIDRKRGTGGLSARANPRRAPPIGRMIDGAIAIIC